MDSRNDTNSILPSFQDTVTNGHWPCGSSSEAVRPARPELILCVWLPEAFSSAAASATRAASSFSSGSGGVEGSYGIRKNPKEFSRLYLRQQQTKVMSIPSKIPCNDSLRIPHWH